MRPHGPQHARLPCPSPTPRACSNSCPSSWVMSPNYLILCHPLLLLPSIFPSIRVLSNESALGIRLPKYWNFSINPSNEYSGLISFRIDWFDLFAVQVTLKSLLQHHSLKASILRCSALFMVQLPHPYVTTGETIALTRWTFVGKVMSLLTQYRQSQWPPSKWTVHIENISLIVGSPPGQDWSRAGIGRLWLMDLLAYFVNRILGAHSRVC